MSSDIRYSNAWSQDDKREFNSLRREILLIAEEMKLAAETRTGRPTPQLAHRFNGLDNALQTANAIKRSSHKLNRSVLTMMLLSLRESVAKAKGQHSDRDKYIEMSSLEDKRGYSVEKATIRL